jgi:F-type H+-transporting ATPase subunit delta
MAKLVSKTYGEALFEVAVEKGIVETLMEEVEMVQTIFQENEEYVKLLNHPKLPVEQKLALLEEAFRGKTSDELTGLLATVVEKGRFSEVNEILAYFEERVREYQKIGTAYVTSAAELTEAQKADVKKRLLDTTPYESFRIQYRVDAGLIGGMVIRIGDRVVDSSIRTKLGNMAKDLSKIQLAR